MSSLRARLLAWLLGGVLLVGVAGGSVVYRNALAEADAFFDYHLRQTALLLRDEPVEYLLAPRIPSTIPATTSSCRCGRSMACASTCRGRTPRCPHFTTLGFSTVNTSGGRWRVFGTESPTKVVQVAQPMSVRRQQAAQLALRTLTPFALLVPVLGLIIWFAVGQALSRCNGWRGR